MAKYWVSGANSEVITAATVSSAEHLLGASITSGRVLWLTGVILPTVTIYTATRMVNIYDAATGTTSTASTNKRLALLPPVATAGPFRPSVVKLPLPGMKFSTGCVVLSEATEIMCGEVGGMGYEV